MMASLQSSIWAPRGQRSFENLRLLNSSSVIRLGEWRCPSCTFNNYEFREHCLRCSTTKSQNPPPADRSTSTLSTVPTIVPQIRSSNVPKPRVSSQQERVLGTGLATSRWAPRRASQGQGQIWTRVRYLYKHRFTANCNQTVHTIPVRENSRPASRSPTRTTTPYSPDLGLPYQVQHFILALMQRLLEEGCYAFATRWIPGILNEKGWDCAEAVELSAWKAFLPGIISPNAIKPLPGYTLEAALADAVRIRNSAVHRHLCNNYELRQMTLRGEDLMSMLSDITRQTKFNQLRTELKAWNPLDPSGARARLETALQEISERPMDDMDWTPNAASLQEVTPAVENTQANIEQLADAFADAMDLD